ncbi:MAG TPA: DUF5615 family PIN-like protein [Fibrobacteria bacterium]|nr:DUF5615 family PIN-like protein [Fibrobacteria bacterium]
MQEGPASLTENRAFFSIGRHCWTISEPFLAAPMPFSDPIHQTWDWSVRGIDENMPSAVVTALTLHGHAVRSMQEFGFGIPDEGVMSKARELGAVLLTRDHDFGRLIFEGGMPPPAGVVLFRLPSSQINSAIEGFNSPLGKSLSLEGFLRPGISMAQRARHEAVGPTPTPHWGAHDDHIPNSSINCPASKAACRPS